MKKTALLGATLLACGILVAGCSSNEDSKQESNGKKTEAKKENKKEEVDYHEQKGWKFEAGDSQSPINIDTKKLEKMKDDGQLSLDYNKSVIDIDDNGHSVQVDDNGKATIDGRKFELSQFYFHAKSEHTVDGKHYPVEAHFVNKAQDGRLAVIGVFFTEGKENKAFQTILNNIKKGKKVNVDDTINIMELMPKNTSYYHYLGSLTTPPLSENVEWYVMKQPVEVSKQQITDFQKYYNSNNRKIQPLNDRKVLDHQAK